MNFPMERFIKDIKAFEEGEMKLPFAYCFYETLFSEEPICDKKITWMNIDELLECINADHSNDWTDYDRSDWHEGMKEWTDFRIVYPFPD